MERFEMAEPFESLLDQDPSGGHGRWTGGAERLGDAGSGPFVDVRR
ncbi:hypothetical protein [Dactylosporangium sp. NPDC000521]